MKKEKKEEKQKSPLISKLIFLLLIFALIYIYARYIGTTGIKVKEYSIESENIPSSFDGFKIVQFSDLELGSTFLISDLDNLVEKINNEKPDVVVFTGDIVSKSYSLSTKEKKELTEKLGEIDPLIGKYSVRGDDDIKSDYESIMEEAGFTDITNSYELIYYKGLTPIVLYGLDSLSGSQDFDKTFEYPSASTDPNYMATYRILLAHEPDTLKRVTRYNISLMLSGHSHNSEINIPYLKSLYHIDGATTYYDEKYTVDATELYVSSGLGTSKFKVRLFSKPSISVFTLYT
jgi:hypothetical protein